MLNKIGVVVGVSILFAGCLGDQTEKLDILGNKLDGIYTLKVKCGVYEGITRNLEVSSGKISGVVQVGDMLTRVIGYVEKNGVVSGYASHTRSRGKITGKVLDWESGIAEGEVEMLGGGAACSGPWSVIQN